MTYVVVMTNGEIYHSGVKGQKWGVRRYQNEDGTLTEEGKKRYRVSDGNNKMSTGTKGKIAAGIGATAAVAAITVYATKNPKALSKALSKASSIKVGMGFAPGKMGPNPTKEMSKAIRTKKTGELIKKGQKALINMGVSAAKGVRDGVKEGAYKGPKKIAEAAVTGGTMLAGYKLLEKSSGKNTAKKIMTANNPKKIDKFMNARSNDDDED